MNLKPEPVAVFASSVAKLLGRWREKAHIRTLEQFPVPCIVFGVKAYSINLRERVVAACALPGVRIHQVAAQCRVSLAFVDNRLRRQRTTGSVAALPSSGGPAPMPDPTGHVRLTACLNQQPNATPDALRTALVAAGGRS